ncbi:hypothetical protein Dsin_012084 [Dipteronia sinensis]|uniref:DUF4283 domain-containing protein n=1 Tax=Dipteronia sinensis TaxID=43782 RepID=A0AAE0AIN1_9ROSI|nr:hypothetical protein Dsin_012084 [Dipteronia sinensis]
MSVDGISKLCASMSLKEREGTARCLKQELKDDGLKKMSLGLVGKVLANKFINMDAIRTVLSRVSKVRGKFIVETVRSNILTFQFQSAEDRKRILMGGLWSFDNFLIVLEEQLGKGDGMESVMLLRYEQLPDHCYQCGSLWHKTRECTSEEDLQGIDSNQEPLFGSWLYESSSMTKTMQCLASACEQSSMGDEMAGDQLLKTNMESMGKRKEISKDLEFRDSESMIGKYRISSAMIDKARDLRISVSLVDKSRDFRPVIEVDLSENMRDFLKDIILNSVVKRIGKICNFFDQANVKGPITLMNSEPSNDQPFTNQAIRNSSQMMDIENLEHGRDTRELVSTGLSEVMKCIVWNVQVLGSGRAFHTLLQGYTSQLVVGNGKNRVNMRKNIDTSKKALNIANQNIRPDSWPNIRKLENK